ncbi:MAG: stage III sporulation protein AE [Thermaerobacter sp.]|nr:stage III sporulation protein AE [Thermaerobacter sp.]
MRKHWLAGLSLGLAVLAVAPGVKAASLPTVVQQQAKTLDTSALDRQLNQLVRGHPGVAIPGVGQIVSDLLHHQNPFNPQTLLRALALAAAGDLATESRLLGIILLLAVMGALLGRLGESVAGSERGGMVQVSRLVVLSALMLVALRSFGLAVGLVTSLVGELVHLMEATIPLLVVLMAGSGAIASAGIFHPLMLATVNLVAVLTKRWVLPLILLATIVELVGDWLPRFSLKNLALLLRQTGLTLLGGLMTIFLGVMTVQGAAGSVADGVTLKTGKFLASTFVPVVGKMFSDAMEAVLGSSLLLKNAVSVVGALAIIVTVTFPLVKLFLMMFLFRVGAAAAQPLDVDGVSDTLATMATAVGWLVAIAGSVALMFFLVLTVVVSTTNGVQL